MKSTVSMDCARRYVMYNTPLQRMQHRWYRLDAALWACTEERLHCVVPRHSTHWLVFVVVLLSRGHPIEAC